MRFTSAGIGSGVEKDIFRLVTDGFDKGLHMEKLHELLENCMNKELQQMVKDFENKFKRIKTEGS